MLKKIGNLKSKLLAFCSCICLVLMFWVPCNVKAQTTGMEIRQDVSASSGQPGDVIQLSVYLQGMTDSIEVAQISGVLEYDTSLFTLQQVVGNELNTTKVSDSSGRFTLEDSFGKTFENGDLLFNILLLINDGASAGKTTICVNEIVITDTAGTSNQISSYVPSTVNLVEADSLEEQEGDEAENYDDFEDVDDYNSLDIGKSDKKHSNSDKKKMTTTSVATKKTSTSEKDTKLDTNYKTGAGFGNDVYLIVAGIMGLSGIALFVVRRKIMKDKHIYL